MREFHVLVGATLFLMSRHAEAASPQLADIIARHLELLGAHPHAGDVVRQWAPQLAKDWQRTDR